MLQNFSPCNSSFAVISWCGELWQTFILLSILMVRQCQCAVVTSTVLLVCIQIVHIDADYVTSLGEVISQLKYKMEPISLQCRLIHSRLMVSVDLSCRTQVKA
jgi:hypothetical protein